MAKLVYSALASLDGFTEDEDGDFSWAAPDEEVHEFVNDLERRIGTHLYGRRMYEVMVAWETIADERPFVRDYAEIWRSAEKVVFSKTLEEVRSARTRIEREFDPEAIAEMKPSAPGDISVGGPDLASQAIAAGLVDETPPISGAGSGGRRQTGPAHQGQTDARATGPPEVQQRYGPPPLPPHPRRGRAISSSVTAAGRGATAMAASLLSITSRVSLALLLVVLAGCGGGSETTSGESPITATVHGWEAALQDHDAVALCDLLAPPVPKNCEAAFERELRGTRTPDLKVRSVKVDGSTARVNIDSPNVAYLDLVRVEGRWYVQLTR